MPHLITEYSSNLKDQINVKKMVAMLHEAAIESDLFNPKDVKSRAKSYDDYMLESHQAFICVHVKIIEGRTDDQKQMLAQKIYDAIERLEVDDLCITVEINDIKRAAYVKN